MEDGSKREALAMCEVSEPREERFVDIDGGAHLMMLAHFMHDVNASFYFVEYPNAAEACEVSEQQSCSRRAALLSLRSGQNHRNWQR